jgi:transcriptional regulator with XRE-family HTH domain
MNVGEKLRQLRQEKNLTQPELAETLGIEQSYLSKLENGKSLPSGDVFNRILEVFGLGLEQFVEELDEGSRNQLRHLPDVADHFTRQKLQLIGNRKRWLLVSSLLLALGTALVYAGTVEFFAGDMVYDYKSLGVTLPGESKELFFDSPETVSARIDEDYLSTRQYRGNTFNVPVEGGSRTYYMDRNRQIDPWQNKAVAMLGVFMMVLGLAGFGLERKLARP